MLRCQKLQQVEPVKIGQLIVGARMFMTCGRCCCMPTLAVLLTFRWWSKQMNILLHHDCRPLWAVEDSHPLKTNKKKKNPNSSCRLVIWLHFSMSDVWSINQTSDTVSKVFCSPSPFDLNEPRFKVTTHLIFKHPHSPTKSIGKTPVAEDQFVNLPTVCFLFLWLSMPSTLI